MSDDESLCESLAPWVDNCSGHGLCLNGTTNGGEEELMCVCNENWSGRSHWVNGEGRDCHIFVPAVQALWAALLAMMLIVMYRYFPKFTRGYMRFRRSQMVKRSHHARERPLRAHTTLYCLTIFFLIHWPLNVSMCILMIVKPSTKIGIEILPTLLWHLGRSSFYVSTSLYQPSMLSTIIAKQDIATLPCFLRPNLQTWLLTIIHFLLGGLAWVAYAFQDDRSVVVWNWLVFFGGTSAVFFVMGFQAWYLKRTLIKQLLVAYQLHRREEILQTKNRMESVQNLIFVHSIFQAFVYGIFAAVPFLWGKYDYLLPISWVTIPSTARVVVRTLMIESACSFKAEGLPTIFSEARGDGEVATNYAETVEQVFSVSDPNLLATGREFSKTVDVMHSGVSINLDDTDISLSMSDDVCHPSQSSNTDVNEFEQTGDHNGTKALSL